MAENEAIAEAFADGPAFIPYLAVGDPNVRGLQSLRRGTRPRRRGHHRTRPPLFGAHRRGADDPKRDRPRTKRRDDALDRFFEFVDELDVDVPLVCMTYYNLIYQYGRSRGGEAGPEAFVKRAAEVGISGFVVPDLPAEEADPLREACDKHGLDLVFIVAPTTEGERLEGMMDRVSGYVYVQARLGTTGAKTDVSDQTSQSLARLSEWDVPKAVGFGISSGDQAARIVANGADGIIVGSALVDIVAEGADSDRPVDETAAQLEMKARELADGTHEGAARQSPDVDTV
jgi:tryptophan synthase, alpha subunit